MDRPVTPSSKRSSTHSGKLSVVLPGGILLSQQHDSPIEDSSSPTQHIPPAPPAAGLEAVQGPTEALGPGEGFAAGGQAGPAPQEGGGVQEPPATEGQVPPPGYREFAKPTWLPSEPWKRFSNLEITPPATAGSDQHWERCRELVQKFDSSTINGWKDEIQTQLLVASLLAAMTGTFIVETQKQLSDDPLLAPTILLAFIASQLNGSTGAPVPGINERLYREPTAIARGINSLFFVSLGLSLANVTLGLLCLQWLRELKLEPPGILSRDYHHFRCVRDHGFQRWGAKGMILALPLLLLSALTTFIAGLLFYVSAEDWIVASPLYVILISILGILLYTTILPAIILIRDGGFHPGGSESKFSPMPPFHSLQAWLVLQGAASMVQTLAKTFNISLFNTFSALRHCPDWGRVDQLWVRWSTSLKGPSLVLPLALSTSNNDDVKNIMRCYEETMPKLMDSPTPAGRRLAVLRYFVGYGTSLPPNTLGQLTARLIEHFCSMVNSGCAIEELGSFSVEGWMNLFAVETSEPIVQLLNAVLNICKTQIPTEESFWDLFWNTLTRAMADFENSVGFGAPAMITEAMDTYQRALENPEIAEFSPRLIGLRHFLFSLHREVNIYPYWSNSELGAQNGRAILCHPVWEKIHASAFAIPSDSDVETFRAHLIFLANFRRRMNLDNVEPSYTLPQSPGVDGDAGGVHTDSPTPFGGFPYPPPGAEGGSSGLEAVVPVDTEKPTTAPDGFMGVGGFYDDGGRQEYEEGIGRKSVESHRLSVALDQSCVVNGPSSQQAGQLSQERLQVPLPLPVQMQQGPPPDPPSPRRVVIGLPPQMTQMDPFGTIRPLVNRTGTLRTPSRSSTLPATLPPGPINPSFRPPASASRSSAVPFNQPVRQPSMLQPQSANIRSPMRQSTRRQATMMPAPGAVRSSTPTQVNPLSTSPTTGRSPDSAVSGLGGQPVLTTRPMFGDVLVDGEATLPLATSGSAIVT